MALFKPPNPVALQRTLNGLGRAPLTSSRNRLCTTSISTAMRTCLVILTQVSWTRILDVLVHGLRACI